MKVTLKRRELTGSGPWHEVHWLTAQPFVVNPRGMLVHRIESAHTYFHEGRPRHTAVHYLCGNGTTADCQFLAEPPENRLVCQACELAAKKAGKPSSDEIVGRHVHIGKIRAERVCCVSAVEAN